MPPQHGLPICLIRLAGAALVPAAALPCRDGQRFTGFFDLRTQAAHADGVFPGGHPPPVLPDGKAAVSQWEGDSLGFTRLQEYPLKTL